MNELRRKLVLGMPLLSVGLFSGCGGGDASESTSLNGGRATTQATDGIGDQTLKVSSLFPYALDSIWTDLNGGGDYFVPSASPSVQAVINGNALYLSMFEQVNLSATVRIFKSLRVTLAVPYQGTALSSGAQYALNGTAANVAEVRVLKRTTNADGSVTDSSYSYSSSTVGSVKIEAITPVSGGNPLYKLAFTTIRFQPSGGAAERPFSLAGSTSLGTPTETAAWI